MTINQVKSLKRDDFIWLVNKSYGESIFTIDKYQIQKIEGNKFTINLIINLMINI